MNSSIVKFLLILCLCGHIVADLEENKIQKRSAQNGDSVWGTGENGNSGNNNQNRNPGNNGNNNWNNGNNQNGNPGNNGNNWNNGNNQNGNPGNNANNNKKPLMNFGFSAFGNKKAELN